MEKYTLNLDENNYVLSIAHTANDDIELDLSQYDLTYLSAYQYKDGKLVLDKEKQNQMKAEEKLISTLTPETEVVEGYRIIKDSNYSLLLGNAVITWIAICILAVCVFRKRKKK